jgi:hypothetical protein
VTNYLRPLASLWPALIPIVVLVGLSASLFPSAGRDDAYITYWAANTLRDFGEIANLNGIHIEQSSSLLHVVVLGLFSRITSISVPTVGPLVSMLSSLLTIIYTFQFARLIVGRWYAFGAAMIVATAVPFVYWTTGGLEGTLAALVTTALIYHMILYLERPEAGRPPWNVWVLMGSFLLVRPESIFVIAAVLATAFVFFRLRGVSVVDERLEYYAVVIRKLLWIALVIAVLMTVILIVKLVYFGSWLPLPVMAKLGGGVLLSRTGDGMQYLVSALLPPPLSLLPFFAIAGVVCVARKIGRDEPEFTGGLLLTLFVLVYMGFILIAGGDWMEGSRFIVPVIPALAVLSVMVVPHIKSREFQVYILAGIVAFQIVGGIWFAKFGSISTPLWEVSSLDTSSLAVEKYSWLARPNRTHLRDIPVVDQLNSVIETLQSDVEGKVTVMSAQAGFVAYHMAREHYKQIEFIDRRGITTSHFTDCGGTKDVQRTTTGLFLTYIAFFANQEDIEQDCGIQRPHVIFDLDLPELIVENVIARNGYVVVYRQTGKIQTSKTLQGIEVLAHEFIAVRNDLQHLFDGPMPKVREWNVE